MSMSSVVSREHAESAVLWELPHVGGEASAASPSSSIRTLRQLESLEQQAREEGFARGLAEGREAARNELATHVRSLASVLDLLAQPLADIDAGIEHELALLATTIATQLIRRELKTQPDEIVGTVRSAVAALPSTARHIKVHLNPADAEIVRATVGSADAGRGWEVVEDGLLTRGGCRVTSEASHVDARLETRIGAVVSAVLGGDRDRDTDGAHA